MKIAIFLSGRGSNFLSIAGSIKLGKLNAEIVLVASNNPDAGGLLRAAELDFNTQVFNRKEYDDGKNFANFMRAKLAEQKVEYIVLAGYLRKMPPLIIQLFKNKIINIHPALLPKFGGKGMYGLKVHKSVIDAGETQSGVTIHYVDDKYDHGKIISQKTLPVLKGDTPETLSARVLKLEHSFYPEVLELISQQNTKLGKI